jgi:hypothetical protein
VNLRELEAQAKALAPVLSKIVDSAIERLRVEIEQKIPQIDVDEVALKAAELVPVPENGKDGESVTIDDVRPIIEELVKSIPVPADGKDGIDGKDGTHGRNGADGKDGVSPTAEDVAKAMDHRFSEWALGFERKADDLFQRAIDRMPKPKDGKDGIDAVQVDDISIELKDGGRVLCYSFKRGDDLVEKEVTTEFPVYRGVWAPGEYQKGDEVTWAGSTWAANVDTKSKPETDDTWRLRTKRGRDGKHGKDGKDLTIGVKRNDAD